jgi:hypothetical protein
MKQVIVLLVAVVIILFSFFFFGASGTGVKYQGYIVKEWGKSRDYETFYIKREYFVILDTVTGKVKAIPDSLLNSVYEDFK